MVAAATATVWVFGYASLLWKAGFEYSERRLGYIKGYRRALHMACFEHRGTWQHPARVATLEEEEGAVCWGYAYAVKDPEATLAYLRERENEYDDTASLPFFWHACTSKIYSSPAASSDLDQQRLQVLVFKSTLDSSVNNYYLGPAPAYDMALQIARACGPCGTNSEYLFRLEAALRSIGHPDPHITLLAHLVRGILVMDTLDIVHHDDHTAAAYTTMAATDTVYNTTRDVGSMAKMLTVSPSFPVDRRRIAITKPLILPAIPN